jgi:hypothetical protein
MKEKLSGRTYIEIKIMVGVSRPVEINNCHFKVDSILSGLSTVIMWVAKNAVMIQTKIPAAESTNGYKKVASWISSLLVPETIY